MATPTSRNKPADTSSKLKAAESRIVSADQSFQYLKALFYGKNGMGKTRLGASGPRDVLLVDCNEKGSLSVRNFPDVRVFPLEIWTDIDIAYWYLHKGDHPYKTVVIDTVTSLAQLCMKFVLGDEASRDPTKDPNMPSKREWGKVGELMRTVILNFRNLDMNVVFLAQERRGFSDDEEEAPEIFPEVSPSVRSTLTASVDIIGRLYVREVVKKGEDGKKEAGPEYRMLIGSSERYVTKDRSESGLPSTVRLGTGTDNLSKLVDRIKKGA
jgi:phage nucleotide-binding protein